MRCFFCGKEHDLGIKCSIITAMEYGEDGSIRRIEFLTFVDIEGLEVAPRAELPPGTTLN